MHSIAESGFARQYFSLISQKARLKSIIGNISICIIHTCKQRKQLVSIDDKIQEKAYKKPQSFLIRSSTSSPFYTKEASNDVTKARSNKPETKFQATTHLLDDHGVRAGPLLPLQGVQIPQSWSRGQTFDLGTN